jgi:Aminoglycoside-2''-adenylyltransferase
MDSDTRIQLTLLPELAVLLDRARVRFWLRGGWALDFHAGRITRDHGDIDLVVRFRQRSRLRKLLEENDYRVVRLSDLASIHFSKGKQDIGLAFIWTDEMARTVTPGREFWPWPDDAFCNRRHTLHGIACRAMSIESLLEEKENYERYTGRPLREKDLVSVKLLRSLLL